MIDEAKKPFALLTGTSRDDRNPTRVLFAADAEAITAAREFVANSGGADPWAFVISKVHADRTFSVSRSKGETWGLYYSFQKYRVTDVSSIEGFLDKYYKRDRYTGRGEEYAACLLKSHKDDVTRFGFDFISHHDSRTSEVVAFYPEEG